MKILFFIAKIIFFSMWFPFSGYSQASIYSEKKIHTALSVFEKATLLSPDLLNSAGPQAVRPFYKFNGHKIYLDEGFWDLTRAWIRLYIDEIEEYCPCDLNPDLMIQTAKDYLPQNFFQQKLKKAGREISYQGAHLTAKYGHTAAVLKLSSEIAETVLSFSVGGKGVHILCNAIDVMIFPLMRGVQKYVRVFSYAKKVEKNALLFSLKMAWLSYNLRKSRDNVFFHIDQALVFRSAEQNKVNHEGPKSLFHKRGHRLLWIERLKQKTDPLFRRIEEWESRLKDIQLSSQEKKRLEQRIQKTYSRIERISRLNRKDFFGMRFKRYLLLKSRKGRIAYMHGKDLPDKVAGRGILWPLSFQENTMERMLESSSKQLNFTAPPDEIRDGLIEEFLSRRAWTLGGTQRNELQSSERRRDEKQAVQYFLSDIEQIFDTNKTPESRLMKAYSIEMTLGGLFAHYMKISGSILSQENQMSFAETVKLQWMFGQFFRLVSEYSDFLASVAISKKTDIQFYKYESLEKLLAFFDYLHEVQVLLSDPSLDKVVIFERLNSQQSRLRAVSLLQEKKTSFSFVPFGRKKPAKCQKLVEKYQ